MKDPKLALLFLQDLQSDPTGILDSGVVFLTNNGITDWYAFVNTDHSVGLVPERMGGALSRVTIDRDTERACSNDVASIIARTPRL